MLSNSNLSRLGASIDANDWDACVLQVPTTLGPKTPRNHSL
jgi:hypothetical protein